jgi:tRNA U34 5-methylaminomethyl-2-thiouridine-forming methyltransferase MnmC
MAKNYEALIQKGNYSLVETEDGSYTLYSKNYGEACHSLTGAIKETNFHYIDGCQIPVLKTQLDFFSILEVGFGLGLGLIETKKALMNSAAKVEFISLEIDQDLVETYLEQENIEYEKIGKVYFFQVLPNLKVKVLVADARNSHEEIQALINKPLMAIYQDAFSPKRNQSLWTKEWFTFLVGLIDSQGILSTYSSSLSVRKTLLAAGFGLKEGGSLGMKRSSTRASLSFSTDPDLQVRLSSEGIHILRDPLTDKTKPF